MKKSMKFLGMLLSLMAITVFVSCSNDDDGPTIGDEVPDGFYIVTVGAEDEPGLGSDLKTSRVPGDGLNVIGERANFFQTFYYLESGSSVVFASYADNVPTFYGGPVQGRRPG